MRRGKTQVKRGKRRLVLVPQPAQEFTHTRPLGPGDSGGLGISTICYIGNGMGSEKTVVSILLPFNKLGQLDMSCISNRED